MSPFPPVHAKTYTPRRNVVVTYSSNRLRNVGRRSCTRSINYAYIRAVVVSMTRKKLYDQKKKLVAALWSTRTRVSYNSPCHSYIHVYVCSIMYVRRDVYFTHTHTPLIINHNVVLIMMLFVMLVQKY